MISIPSGSNGYRLITAEILYHLPDHPSVLQSFIWQEYDWEPNFPRLLKFLNFWSTSLEGKLHSVSVAHRASLLSTEIRHAKISLNLH
jgi:uncharacterized protein Usg